MRLLVPLFLVLTITHTFFGQDLMQMAVRGPDYIEFKRAIDAHPEAVQTAQTADGKTLLHLSAANRHQEGVFALLADHANPNVKDHLGWTPLMEVIGTDEKKPPGEDAVMISEMLIFAGADPNIVAMDGTNALYLAANMGNRYLVEFLLRAGANPTPAGAPADKMAITRAFQRDDKELIALLQHPPPVASKHPTSTKTSGEKIFNRKFDQAVVAADFDTIDQFARDGVDINQQNDDGETSLFYATKVTRPEVVAFLLLEGANPNVTQKEGRTPLIESTRFFTTLGHRMTAMLLLSGADIGTVTKEGWTPLSHAVICSNVVAAKLLIYSGANLNVQTPKGSLMQAALAAGWQDTISVLKQLGVLEETRSKEIDNTPAIVQAVRRGDYEVVKAQLQQGAPPSPVEVPDLVGEAFQQHRFDIADLLLAHGANINYQNKYGWSTLFTLAAAGSQGGNAYDSKRAAEVITEMAKRGVNIDMQASDGTTPLMIAARQGLIGANTQALLTAGANVNARNNKGQTPLAIAQQFGRKEMIEFLQARGGVD